MAGGSGGRSRKSVEAPGIEASEIVQLTMVHGESRSTEPPRVDVSARELVVFGPSETGVDVAGEGVSPLPRHGPAGPVEGALAAALLDASKAGRWDVVTQLARELEARRLAADGATKASRDQTGRFGGQVS
jgi:hypothetical protein